MAQPQGLSRYHALTDCCLFLELSIVIAKSDLIILVVSSSRLGAAIYRWDQNTRDVNTSTVLANTRVEAPASPVNSDDGNLITTSIATAGSSSVELNPQPETASLPVVVETVPVEDEQPARPFLIHVVRSGDSLSEIAARYNTSVRALREANGISGSTIFIGQEILYPAN